MSLGLLVRGVVFGIAAAASIGPVNIEIARRALRFGFLAAFSLGCGAVTIDVSYAVISALGVAPLLRDQQGHHPWFYWPMTAGCVGLLAYLGIMSLKGAREIARLDLLRVKPAAQSSLNRGGYITGLLMTGLSPLTLGFWFVVLPKYAGDIAQQPRHDLPIIVLGVFIATIGWVIGFAGLLSIAGRWRRAWWLTAADEFGGAMLLALSIAVFLRSFQ